MNKVIQNIYKMHIPQNTTSKAHRHTIYYNKNFTLGTKINILVFLKEKQLVVIQSFLIEIQEYQIIVSDKRKNNSISILNLPGVRDEGAV